jgi:uncharacterized NAD-dependent epimerase/dehydratase family protein
METAIILTGGLLETTDAKTAHGLIRESNRFKIVGIVDPASAGRDAGELLDGVHRDIPVFADIKEALVTGPRVCIVGVATIGGVFPESMLNDVRVAISAGLSVVNGLHDYLSDRSDINELAKAQGVELIDVRKPKLRKDLHFWTGDIYKLMTPVVAVLGTDCALGKRTTARLLLNACKDAGLKAQMVYTGQTGWLQGGEYGFIFDSTLNDFVAGELEHAIISCAKKEDPEIIFLEGQSALRNPSGPCGSEFLVSGNARHAILVHAPKRKHYDHLEEWGEIHSLQSEIALINMYGSSVMAVALNTESCTQEEALDFQKHYEEKLGIPVLLPLSEGCQRIVPMLSSLSKSHASLKNQE